MQTLVPVLSLWHPHRYWWNSEKVNILRSILNQMQHIHLWFARSVMQQRCSYNVCAFPFFLYTLISSSLCPPPPSFPSLFLFYFPLLFKCSPLSGSPPPSVQFPFSISLLPSLPGSHILPSRLHACLLMSLLTLLKFFIAPLLAIFCYSLSFNCLTCLNSHSSPSLKNLLVLKKEQRIESYCLCQRIILTEQKVSPPAI